MVSNGKAVSWCINKKRRTGGKTGERRRLKKSRSSSPSETEVPDFSVAQVEELASEVEKEPRDGKRLSRDWATRWRRRCWR